MKQVKELYTIGSANESNKILTEILGLGNSGAMLSLNTADYYNDMKVIENVRKFNSENHTDTNIFVNIVGNEIRTHRFKGGEAFLSVNEQIVISTDTIDEGAAQKFSVTYSKLNEDVQVGNLIYINCGKILLKVQRLERNEIVCIVLKGGICYDYSTVNAAKQSKCQRIDA